ncbi:hypothetical protein HFN89_00500 [Rhizobium laguerreae]|nr:hypothetical protein [Rhizobium laguerreae]
MTASMTDSQLLDEALASYLEQSAEVYDPRLGDHRFDGFRTFAESVIGDAFRKIKVHAFPKVDAAPDEGISIGAISLIPLRGPMAGSTNSPSAKTTSIGSSSGHSIHRPRPGAAVHRIRSSCFAPARSTGSATRTFPTGTGRTTGSATDATTAPACFRD